MFRLGLARADRSLGYFSKQEATWRLETGPLFWNKKWHPRSRKERRIASSALPLSHEMLYCLLPDLALHAPHSSDGKHQALRKFLFRVSGDDLSD
jgi:hypothetical protein